MDKTDDQISAPAAFLSHLLLLALGLLWGCWVTSQLWLWFAVPLGMPAINQWHVGGLSMLLGMFLSYRGLDRNDIGRKAHIFRWVYHTLTPGVCYLLGLALKGLI